MKKLKAMPKIANRPPKYDWDKLLNGDAYELKRGTDFHCFTSSFQSLAHITANNRGLRMITMRQDDDTIALMAVPK